MHGAPAPPPCSTPAAPLQAAGAGAAAEAAAEEEEEAAPEEEARPTRVVEEEITLVIAVRTVVVDYEGRSDGRSMRTIVSQLAPRQLAVVGAGAAAVDEMAGGWREDRARCGARVATPGGCA